LPLEPKSLRSIAVIGPFAAKPMTGGGGSSQVVPLYTVAPVDGIRQRVGPKVKVVFADGKNVPEAVALAKASDVAVVMVGDDETEGRDHSLTLSGKQDALVEAVAAANPRTVVLLKTGSPIFMPWVDKVPAILEAWYPGEEDGCAVAAVLFGDVNPSGKLPITFPRRLADLAANTPDKYPGTNNVVHYSEGVFVGYRHFDAENIDPLFPFGYGLSYTTFTYKNLSISSKNFSAGSNSRGTLAIDFEVANSGKKFGKEVVQLYVEFPSTTAIPQPPKQLKGFEKVALRPGQSRRVHLMMDARSFSYWDINTHDWKIMPGTYRIMVGSSSRDIQLRDSLQVNPL